jgi:hypothetical protein
MKVKTEILQLPVFVAIVIVLLVIYIVSCTESPITKASQWLSMQIEGFGMPVLTTPKCPIGYKFFNDEKGESFCCGGEVNPYSHTCLAKGKNMICAFKPTKSLPLCSTLIKASHSASQTNFCPARFSNYASIGKCCYNHSDLDGYDCSKEDNADTSKYCKINGPLKAGEQLCSSIRMSEKAACPSGLSKINYTLGPREVAKYGTKANGISIPVCFGIDNTCIPDNVITELQKNGIYDDKKNLPAWKYSCSGWDKINIKRDLTGKMETNYL